MKVNNEDNGDAIGHVSLWKYTSIALYRLCVNPACCSDCMKFTYGQLQPFIETQVPNESSTLHDEYQEES